MVARKPRVSFYYTLGYYPFPFQGNLSLTLPSLPGPHPTPKKQRRLRPTIRSRLRDHQSVGQLKQAGNRRPAVIRPCHANFVWEQNNCRWV